MFKEAIFIIAKKVRTIQLMQYIHTMEYYSAIKRDEIVSHAPTWMSLENTVLRKTNWTQKVRYDDFPLCEMCRTGNP